MRFVDVKNDLALQKIFGDESRKEILISFLNAGLLREGERKIVSVDMSPYYFFSVHGGEMTILYMRAIDQKKQAFLIEMLVDRVGNSQKQVLYYAYRKYFHKTGKRGEREALNPDFLIGILDFEVAQSKEYINRRQVMDTKAGEQFIRSMELILIELPKFKNQANELGGIIDQWIYFIKNAGDIKVIPENITDEGLKNAYFVAELYNWSAEELASYDYASMKVQDYRGQITFAVREAVRQKEEEMKKAMEREKEEMAKAMRQEKEEMTLKLLDLGLSIENISKATDLTAEETEKLKSGRKKLTLKHYKL